MSVRASTWAWSLEEVMGSEALVLLALADQANDEAFVGPRKKNWRLRPVNQLVLCGVRCGAWKKWGC